MRRIRMLGLGFALLLASFLPTATASARDYANVSVSVVAYRGHRRYYRECDCYRYYPYDPYYSYYPYHHYRYYRWHRGRDDWHYRRHYWRHRDWDDD